jgi:uncharacterized protein YkwD
MTGWLFRSLRIGAPHLSMLALLSAVAAAGTASADIRGDALAAHNSARTRSGLRPLFIHAQLNAAAQKHADYMAAQCKLDHRGPGGQMFIERACAAGYQTDSVNSSENVAEGPAEHFNAKWVTDAWLESKVGHRDNVLCAAWHDVGFGMARGRDGRVYWCAVYGRRMNAKR